MTFVAAGAAWLLWTLASYPRQTAALVLASLAMSGASLWSCRRLFGAQAATLFLVIAVPLGWVAEELGSTKGWLFGSYFYTDVLGPKLGSVPLVIPLMWFGLAHMTLVVASFALWRDASPRRFGWKDVTLTALLAAMLVTAFDLGADPYFVYQLKAWIMAETHGDWFGEPVQGFEGWMIVGFAIVALFLANVAPRAASPKTKTDRIAGLLPVAMFAGLMVFQMLFLAQPELRAVAFFAMGIPSLVAAAGWARWCGEREQTTRGRATHWLAMTRVADPVADRAVAAIVGNDSVSADNGRALARLADATKLMAAWTTNGSLDSWSPADADPAIVAALRTYLDEARGLPEWARTADIEGAEALFMDYGPLSCVLLFCASLPECYVLPHLAQVLHVAGQLEAHTEHRIRQTAAMVFPVMMKGGLTAGDGGGVAQVLKVRLIHATIRHLILRGPPELAAGRIEALPQVPGGRSLHRALLACGWDVRTQGLPCNQLELAYTLLTFSYVFLRGLRTLGMRLTNPQEIAYLHAWNVAGHVLGIRSDLMAHSMAEAEAMFESIQELAREEAIEPDVRPALGGALMATMEKSLTLPVIRGLPVPLTRWLVGRATAREIGVNERVGVLTRLLFAFAMVSVRVFDALARLVVPDFSLTRMFTRVVGYHFMTQFLLDQTRPLALPEEVLKPMRETVATWHDHPRAPRWMNRLEDRLTTHGEWRTAE
ncbi:MAG TPA: carotenoid biosynthesis protein [Ramlibacter sp.]|uniref:carotenoid biosynthesis protein n=1 Tax=Ramlibacter sp. TaxID=1917967 RepID=UPI002BCC55F1|nr:carotenoid biosynthesis protein [Ramlibacter sp.]HVZ42165.1 carotenoid biosynthesis protein [Ramlibacter sp.]